MNPLRELFHAKVRRELDDCYRILDLGCGPSSYTGILKKKHYAVGVDAYQGHIDESKAKGLHNEYIKSDIMDVEFPPKSFDAVMACQVIEHLTEEDAKVLLARMEQWAAKKIFITVPNSPRGFMETHPDDLHSPGYDRYSDRTVMNHVSGWTVEKLQALGYHVNGFQGFERFFGKTGFQKFLYYASFPFTYFIPRRAFQLLAVKNV